MEKKAFIEKLAREAYEKGSFNGTWLYAENGKIVSKGAYGWRDAENKLPMQEDTIFEMASITKMFTATAVMLLAREGRLDVDDEYTKYFPDYPYPGVTIRHLLTHTSGMPDDFETDTWVCPAWENERRIPPCSEILRFIRESGEEASHAPGETFRYTDIGYCLLANLVEKLSGVPFEDFLKKNVFEPAGMKDSAIYHTRRDGRPSDRFARNMVLEEDGSYVPSDLSEETAAYVVGSDGLNGSALNVLFGAGADYSGAIASTAAIHVTYDGSAWIKENVGFAFDDTGAAPERERAADVFVAHFANRSDLVFARRAARDGDQDAQLGAARLCYFVLHGAGQRDDRRAVFQFYHDVPRTRRILTFGRCFNKVFHTYLLCFFRPVIHIINRVFHRRGLA